ncbi:unnamed protein product, partial [Closterium sp. NIES-53]
MLTYQLTYDLYIGLLEEQMTHLRMGEQETAIDYCNQAQHLLICMWMAGVKYSTASYITHAIKGLPSGYNLIKRPSYITHVIEGLPGMRDLLIEDSFTLHILKTRRRRRPTIPQSSCHRRNTSPRRSKEVGRGKAASLAVVAAEVESWPRTPTRPSRLRMAVVEEEVGVESVGCASTPATSPSSAPTARTLMTTTTSEVDGAKDADSSAGGKKRGNKEASCSLVGVMEPTVPLAPEAGEDLEAVATVMRLLASLLGEVDVDHDEDGGSADDCFGGFVVASQHEAATGLDIKPSAGTHATCILCVGGKLVRHTFPDKGSDTDDAMTVDRKTRYVWVRPVAKNPDVLWEFENMAEREMRTAMEFVRKMLLHMGVQHQRRHLVMRQAVWVRNCLERVITTSDVVFYETMLLEVWKSEHGPASGRTQANLPRDTLTTTIPLLAEVGELADEDAKDVRPTSPSLAPPTPPLVADLH